jgi:hypothetical protein
VNDTPPPEHPVLDGIPVINEEAYLGDGLYVSFDGWGLRLRAPRDGGDHFVVLDPDTFGPLLSWTARFPRMRRHLEGRQ